MSIFEAWNTCNILSKQKNVQHAHIQKLSMAPRQTVGKKGNSSLIKASATWATQLNANARERNATKRTEPQSAVNVSSTPKPATEDGQSANMQLF